MTKRTIKPATPGLVVRRPDNARPLAAQGEAVEWSAYWQRRLNDGDVIEAAVPNSAQAVQEQPQADPVPVEPGKKGGTK